MPCYATTSNEECKVLMLYTGGTIGMKRNSRGAYAPASYQDFMKTVSDSPTLNESSDDNLFVNYSLGSTCVKINYEIKHYDPLLDSSNMSIKDWIKIAKDIKNKYDCYDAFIVLHGTDTLAYTASALSFMLEGLTKTVIITGAQLSIFEPRNDAEDNMYGSLIFAATAKIPEVCGFFGNKLMRGNRIYKYSASMLEAFISPDYPLLGTAGVAFKVFRGHTRRNENNSLVLHENLCTDISIVKIFPTITATMLEGILGEASKLKGVVFESYGSGNVPTNNTDFMNLVGQAINRGLIIINVTQCAEGTVSSAYETGRELEDRGVVAGYDMTASAAFTKLAVVLGMNKTRSEKIELLKRDFCGEMTLPN